VDVAVREGLNNLVGALLEASSSANVQSVSPREDGSSNTVIKQTPLSVTAEAGHSNVIEVLQDFKGT